MTNLNTYAKLMVLILLIGTAAAAVIKADDPPDFIGMQAGPKVNLGLAQSVRDELKLSADQQATLRMLSERFSESFRELDSQNRKAPSPTFVDKLNALEAETAKELANILTAEQKHRLDQIALQAIGLLAASQPYTAAKLKMTSQQSRLVASVEQEYYRKMRAAKLNKKLDKKTYQTILRETETQIAAILTSDQNAQWKEMIGKEFNVDRLHEENFAR